MRVEIVLVHKTLTHTKAKLSEPHCGSVVVKAHATDMGNAVFFAVNAETMQMVITPPKSDLQNVVQVGNRAVTADQHSSPDHRADALE